MRIEKSNGFDITEQDGLKLSAKVVSDSAVEKAGTDYFSKKDKNIQATYANPANEGEGTISDVMAQANGLDATLMKNEMLVSGNTTTQNDADALKQEGFSLHNTEAKTIVTETDKIKLQLAKAGVDVSNMGDGLSEEKLQEMTGNVAVAVQIEGSLGGANLPATEENVTETTEVLEQTKNMTELSDGAVKYMLDNELPPTVENLYKAEYSGSAGYVAPQGNTMDYDALAGQMDAVIEKAGMTGDETAVEYSKFMLDNDIALTPENLNYMKELKNMTFPLEQKQVLAAVTDAISEGNRPKDAMLVEGYSKMDQAKDALSVITDATEAEVDYVVSKGLTLNINNLAEAKDELMGQNQAEETKGVSADDGTDDITLVTARRQLEETRLIMTTQANYALLKQGIEIDTKPLEELVEELKNTEKNYYAALLEQDGIEATTENVALYAKTMDTVEELAFMPAYTLAIPEADTDTLEGLHQAGSVLQETMKRANESYETMKTEPRRDLGDSLQKAFQNVDDILSDLSLDTSEENERAVRILAYNSLSITTDSVTVIKAADAEVQRAFQNLSPAVVREMIKQGVNPLDMNISDLNVKAEEIKESIQGDDSERFGEYLYKLEQNNGISEEEREAYIGIYRLLNQVEKTDGAAIGGLVAQGAEVTMRNLMTNVRSMKHSNQEVTIDDSFGEKTESTGVSNSITDQIEKGYQTSCAKSSLDLLTPERMKMVMNQTQWEELTPEQLLEQLRNANASSQEEKGYAKEQLNDFTACMNASEDIYQVLANYDIPNTMYHVMAVQEMMTNRNGAFRQLFSRDTSAEETENDDIDAATAEMIEEYGEAIKTPEAMKEAQEKLEKTAASVMDTMLVDNANVTSMKVKEMKLMRTQIELSGKMAAKEETYAIPILIKNEITSVRLKVVRGEEEKGLVNITFETDSLGKVAAELKASGEEVTGYVASDKKETVALFLENAEAVEQAVGGEEKTAKLQFIESDTLDLNSFSKVQSSEGEGEKEVAKIQTASLYGIAKNFIETVKTL